MSRCKNLFFTILLFSLMSSPALAQDKQAQTITDNLPKAFTRSTISISYLSWTEIVDFESASNTDRGAANFYGNAISFEKEYYNKKRSGFAFEASVLSGQANVGGSQTVLTYQDSYKKYFGFLASARYAYRLTNVLTFSVGPMALYRSVKLPVLNDVTAKSGSDLNFGVLGELGVRLGRNFELRQTFGSLSFKANAIWSVGLGYKF